MAKSVKSGPAGYDYRLDSTTPLNYLIQEWEADGFGPLLEEARRRRQLKETEADEAVLRYFMALPAPKMPEGGK